MLDHYNAGDWRAQRVLVTGDLIQDDSLEAYERFRELMSPLNLRVHCVPGNHDIRDSMRAVCCRPPFSYCAWEEIGDWLIIGIDSCVGGDAGGLVTAAELDRMSGVITGSAAKHVMVCLHHPPVKMGSAWLDSVGLRNGDEFLDRLRMVGRVRIATFGHVHQEYDTEHKGIRVVATPATCRQFQPGSDDFAVDDRPPAYRRYELNPDGSVETELVWVDA